MGANAYPLISGGSIGWNIAGDRKEVVRYISHATWSTRIATFGPTPGKEQSSSSILETSDSNPSPSRCATCFKYLFTVCNYENWKWRKIYPDFFFSKYLSIPKWLTHQLHQPHLSVSWLLCPLSHHSFVMKEWGIRVWWYCINMAYHDIYIYVLFMGAPSLEHKFRFHVGEQVTPKHLISRPIHRAVFKLNIIIQDAVSENGL